MVNGKFIGYAILPTSLNTRSTMQALLPAPGRGRQKSRRNTKTSNKKRSHYRLPCRPDKRSAIRQTLMSDSGVNALSTQRLQIYAFSLRITSVALVPPKPKLLDMTVVSSRSVASVTMFRPAACSSISSMLMLGAIKPCSSISSE